MFTDEQKAALVAPLSKAHVKKNPRGYDYVEGWMAIAEANRVFGFDGWDRQTMDMRQLGEPELVGANWRVAYHCRVRVTVRAGSDTITRDGSGYGSGIVKDIRDAHESAIKEAETDAMKRALMTFGNPFGLALYDKAQANVIDESKPRPVTLIERNSFMVECREIISQFTEPDQLYAWWMSDAQKTARRKYELDEFQVDTLKKAVIDRRSALTEKKVDGLRSRAPTARDNRPKEDPISSGPIEPPRDSKYLNDDIPF